MEIKDFQNSQERMVIIMNFEIVKRDLFTLPEEYYLAHCISADYALGAGIAKEFNRKYDMRRKLKKYAADRNIVGTAVLIENVFNLITKERYFQKPSYENLTSALIAMREYSVLKKINSIGMPKIGCGLDRLEWNRVEKIITDVFEDTDCSITICEL